ncbi:MAG: DNA translocase FtsK [Calditrichia bacterium]
MGSKSKKANKTKNKSGKGQNASTQTRLKQELGGLILIALGVLLALAIISYHPGDPVGFLDENNIYKTRNWLGIFGSTISAPLFQWTLGYPILCIPVLLVVYGFCLLLYIPLKKLRRFTLYLILWSIFISVVLAMPEALKTFGNFQAFYPSGFIGGIISAYLVKFFSKLGAMFILSVLFLILLVTTFHVPISVLPRFVGKAIRSFFRIVGHWFSSLRQKRPSRPEYVPDTEPVAEPVVKKKLKEEAESRQDPYYQPSLPSEKEAGIEMGRDPLEIVSRSSQTKTSPVVDDKLSAPPLSASEPGETEAALQEKIEGEKEAGFEIQEAHQEKELDYDALVRDSLAKYQFPSTELLIEPLDQEPQLSEEELKSNARLLEQAIAQFGVKAVVTRVVEGPVITLYEVKPAQGVKISQIVNLADDLALAMRAKGIRMIAPIPGKAAIGIEIPNRHPSTVHFRSIVRSETFLQFEANLPLGMGKTISGEVYCADLTKMPHLLIAGATGSGKSVGINTMIASLLYRIPPSDLKFVLIDPKKLELSIYGKLKDHYLAICPELDEVVITHPQNAIMVLRSVVNEMEERYDKLAFMGVREITHYNRKIEEYQRHGETSERYRRLPYIVVIIDELADLILSAMREVEEPITRLAQMARAVGIHLILATQRPSVDILTGLIKANFPARIAYQVATRPDSKVILDMYGAEKLIGNGDMLFYPPGKVKPLRLQNPLITTEEVERIIKHIRRQPKFPPYELKLVRTQSRENAGSAKAFERDELFEKARDIIIRYQQGSVSLLQRKLKIGYARAARIVDELEEAGIVGPAIEGKAREVLVSSYSPDSKET